MTKLEPNSLLVVVATPWDDSLTERVEAAYADIFGGPFSKDDHSIFVDGTTLAVERDDALEALEEIVLSAQPPFAETEVFATQSQKCSWRISVSNAEVNDLAAFKKVLLCLSASGALAFFVPATMRIFSPSFVRQSASDPSSHTSVHLFVHAWNADDVMRTRGLTSVGLPELEISTNGGLNGAFFNLMDVAAACVESQTPLEVERTVLIGPLRFVLTSAPHRIDEVNPVAGHFGALRLNPM